MNASDLIQSYFDPDAVARLAQAAGLEPDVAGQALAAGLPLQLRALAEASKTPEGEAQIAGAVEALPSFGSVGAALDEPGGAANLQQAGELLAPALLGDAGLTLPAQVAGQTAADPAGAQRLLQLALPLLLSALGQRGLKAGNIAPMLAGLGGTNLDGTGLSRIEPDSAAQDGLASGSPAQVEAVQDRTTVPAAAVPAPLPQQPAAQISTSPADSGPAESVQADAVTTDPVKPAPEKTDAAQAMPLDPTPAEAPLPEPVTVDAVPVELPKAESVPATTADPEPVAVPSAPLEAEAPAAATAAPVMAAPAPAAAAPMPPDPSTPEGLLHALQTRFGGAVGQQLGAVAGFGGGVRKQAALAALPVVLAALAGKAGAGTNLDTLARPFAPLTGQDGQVNTELLDSPVEVARIEGQGRGLLPTLFGDVNAVTGRLGSALGGSGDSSRRLLALMTPLVLSALGSLRPDGLGAVPWGALADSLKGALPSGFSSLGALIGSLVSGTPLPGAAPAAAPLARSAPATPARPSPLKPARPARFETPAPPPPPPARRRGFPLWLLPLLLLLLLGGCWVLQNRAPLSPTPAPGNTTSENSAAGDGVADGSGAMPGMPVQTVFTTPDSGAAVPADGFSLGGTGRAGETVEVFLGDTLVGSAPVGPDGTWTLDVEGGAPTGPQTYTLKNAAGGEMAALDVVVGAAGTAEPGTEPAGEDPAGAGTDAAGAATDGTASTSGASGAPVNAAGAGVTVETPASGAQVSGAGFTLSGTGTAGQTFEVLEDGVSIGSFTVDTDGNWSRPVPAPGEGARTYTIRSAGGDEVATVPVTVGAASASAQGAACNEPLSVSLSDGETVTAPYRLGGEGSGRAYVVTVLRGDRVVGRKTVPVGAGCTWSFTSNPGVRAGRAASVTYEIRPAGADASDAPGARLTLNVR